MDVSMDVSMGVSMDMSLDMGMDMDMDSIHQTNVNVKLEIWTLFMNTKTVLKC